MIDIVAIKQAVKQGQLKAYVKDGKIYLQDDIGETVDIGNVEQGHWVSNEDDDLKISDYTCSNCGKLSDEQTNFCSDCGFSMKVWKED